MSNDTLDRLMTTLAVHLHTFAVCRINPGWRLRLGRMEQITIHYVLEGSGTLRLEEGGGAAFEPHSIILVPPGQAQSLAGPGDVLREARQSKDHELRLKAIARAEKQIEFEGRLLGELQDGATVNVAIMPEWLALRAALLAALAPYPEARLAVAERLAALETGA